MKRLAALTLALTLTGCPALWSALPHVAAGASWLSSVLDLADQAADIYDARHPDQARDAQVIAALRAARQAAATLHAAVVAAGGTDDPTLIAARDAALERYEQLRQLLEGYGILDGLAPPGGAESESLPEPEVFYLPSTAELAAHMGGAP